MEQKKIKGTKKTQKNKNETITKCNRYINLGVNSTFNVGDDAYILSETEYTSLTDKATANDDAIISELKETITEKEKEIANLTAKITTLETSNKDLTNQVGNISKLQQENTELNNLIRSKEKELAKYTAIDIDKLQQKATELETENKELSNKVTNRDEYIIYLELLQTDYKLLVQHLNNYLSLYKHRNIINRVINKDVASDIDKPQLEMMDFKGNISDEAKAPIIVIDKSNVNKSE